jgi:excisionase family DNA binding protein
MKQIRNPQQLNLFRSSRFITTGEAASMLKVCVGTVCNLIEEGLLQAYRRRKRGWYMVSYESCIELLERWAEQTFSSAAVDSDDSHDSRKTERIAR